MADQESESGEIGSVTRTISIIEEIQNRGSAEVTELSDAIGVSKSTIHNHLSTLRRKRFVIKEDGKYRLGLRFLDFGGYVQKFTPRYRSLYQSSKPVLKELVNETGENAQLIVEEGGKGIILSLERGENAITTDTYVGKEIYLHSSSGKVILAFLPPERVEEIVATHGLPAFTERTITDPDELEGRLEEIREKEYTISYQERMEGMVACSVPILDNGEILADLAVSGPTRRMDDDYLEELPEILKEFRRMIELETQYS